MHNNHQCKLHKNNVYPEKKHDNPIKKNLKFLIYSIKKLFYFLFKKLYYKENEDLNRLKYN